MSTTYPDLPAHSNLHPKEVAAFLRVSLATVYANIAAGGLPHIRVGRILRVPRGPFVAWYEKSLLPPHFPSK